MAYMSDEEKKEKDKETKKGCTFALIIGIIGVIISVLVRDFEMGFTITILILFGIIGIYAFIRKKTGNW